MVSEGVTDVDPESATDPGEGDISQVSAFAEVQDRTTDSPWLMEDWSVPKDTVGGLTTLTDTFFDIDWPLADQVMVYWVVSTGERSLEPLGLTVHEFPLSSVRIELSTADESALNVHETVTFCPFSMVLFEAVISPLMLVSSQEARKHVNAIKIMKNNLEINGECFECFIMSHHF